MMWDVAEPPIETEPHHGLGAEDAVVITDPDGPRPDILLESVPTQQDDLKPLPPAPPPALPEPPLDPDILSALGETTDEGPIWGQEIHNNLAQLWLPLLKKGMVKEMRNQILKQYLIPGNCTLLQAPKLNIEISAAVPEMVKLRDNKVESSQQQLGAGITAISKAMTSLITSDNKLEAIKTLSDGCRILCDLHHIETQARIKMVTPGLAKPFLNVIQDSERDETLFGSTLPDKIKASKTIEKQGLQIKKTVPLPAKSNTNIQSQNMSARHQFQGNWAGPSRYPTNRGGRGGQRRFPTSTRRSAAATATATSLSKANQNRSRAPARQ